MDQHGNGSQAPMSIGANVPYQAYPQLYHHQQQPLQPPHHQIFWAEQYREIERTTDFKNLSLPLARIKKIMKADEDVKMIAAEAPVVFARAAEIFILELTLRSWAHAEENKRRTLQKSDVAAAIIRTEDYDFLVDLVPREDGKEDIVGPSSMTAPQGDPLSYHYVQQ